MIWKFLKQNVFFPKGLNGDLVYWPSAERSLFYSDTAVELAIFENQPVTSDYWLASGAN